MPRGIIQDEQVAGALEGDILVGVVQEDLKDLRIGMPKLERIEFTRSCRDTFRIIHSEMGSII